MSLESLTKSTKKLRESVKSFQDFKELLCHNEKSSLKSLDPINHSIFNVNKNEMFSPLKNFGYAGLDEKGNCISINKIDTHTRRNLYSVPDNDTYYRVKSNNDYVFCTKNGHFIINEYGNVLTNEGYHVIGYKIKNCKDISRLKSSSFPKTLNLINSYTIKNQPTTKLSLFNSININGSIFNNSMLNYRNISMYSNKIRTVLYNKEGKEHIADLIVLKTGNREWKICITIYEYNKIEHNLNLLRGYVVKKKEMNNNAIVCNPIMFHCNEKGNVIQSKRSLTISSKDKRYNFPLQINLKILNINNTTDTHVNRISVRANGFPFGTLNRYVINGKGLITGYYSNNKKIKLAQISCLEVKNSIDKKSLSNNKLNFLRENKNNKVDSKESLDKRNYKDITVKHATSYDENGIKSYISDIFMKGDVVDGVEFTKL